MLIIFLRISLFSFTVFSIFFFLFIKYVFLILYISLLSNSSFLLCSCGHIEMCINIVCNKQLYNTDGVNKINTSTFLFCLYQIHNNTNTSMCSYQIQYKHVSILLVNKHDSILSNTTYLKYQGLNTHQQTSTYKSIINHVPTIANTRLYTCTTTIRDQLLI